MLGLQLGLQGRNPLAVNLPLLIRLFPEGGGPVFKELLQPSVENGGLKFQLLAKVGYRNLLNQVPAQNRNLLFRGIMHAMFAHGVPPVVYVLYTAEHSIFNWGKTKVALSIKVARSIVFSIYACTGGGNA